MDIVRKYWLVGAAFIGGLIIGLIFAWLVWPVEWTDAAPAQLSEEHQQAFVKMTSELYAFNNNQAMIQQALGGWGGDVVACEMSATTADEAERARLELAAAAVNGVGCADTAEGVVPEEEGGGGSSTWLVILGLLLV